MSRKPCRGINFPTALMKRSNFFNMILFCSDICWKFSKYLFSASESHKAFFTDALIMIVLVMIAHQNKDQEKKNGKIIFLVKVNGLDEKHSKIAALDVA